MSGRLWTSSFLLVLGLALAAGWLPGGTLLPGRSASGGDPAQEDRVPFDHLAHIAVLEGDEGCRICHPDPSQPKTRETSASCVTCHEGVGP